MLLFQIVLVYIAAKHGIQDQRMTFLMLPAKPMADRWSIEIKLDALSGANRQVAAPTPIATTAVKMLKLRMTAAVSSAYHSSTRSAKPSGPFTLGKGSLGISLPRNFQPSQQGKHSLRVTPETDLAEGLPSIFDTPFQKSVFWYETADHIAMLAVDPFPVSSDRLAHIAIGGSEKQCPHVLLSNLP